MQNYIKILRLYIIQLNEIINVLLVCLDMNVSFFNSMFLYIKICNILIFVISLEIAEMLVKLPFHFRF